MAILYGLLKWTTNPPLLDQEEWETGVINGLLMLKIDRAYILPFCQMMLKRMNKKHNDNDMVFLTMLINY